MIGVAPQADVDEAATFATGWAQAVAATQKPVVSKLFEMPGVPGHFIMIGVPIVREGKVKLALGARVRSDNFGALLRQQQAPPNGALSLVDADYRIVARTKQESTYVGTRVQPGVRRLAAPRTPKATGRPRRATEHRSMRPSAARRSPA